MPDFASLEKTSALYSFLQNVYFSRKPKPNLHEHVVSEYIDKTLHLLKGLTNDDFHRAFRERNSFVLSHKDNLVSAFHLSDLEKNILELTLNEEEKLQRLRSISLPD